MPHYLPGSPGALQKLKEFASHVGLPPAAARGGAATMYPEYQRTMKRPARPASAATPAATGDSRPHAERAAADNTLRVLHVQGKVHMIVGDGGNIVVQAGDEGVLVVDTGLEARGDELLAAIRRISDKPIRLVINTHVHADHTGANELLARVGESLGGNAPGNSGLPLATARVLAHEKVMARMSAPTGQTPPRPFGAWPTETFFSDDKEIFFNDEAIQLIYQPATPTVTCSCSSAAPMSSRAATCSRRRRIRCIDVARGGSVQGIIDGLNRLLDITIPKDKAEGGTYVVPGHGRLSRRGRRRRVPRHADDRSRSDSGSDCGREVAGRGQSCRPDPRLRRPLRRDHWSHGPRISSSRRSIASLHDRNLSG